MQAQALDAETNQYLSSAVLLSYPPRVRFFTPRIVRDGDAAREQGEGQGRRRRSERLHRRPQPVLQHAGEMLCTPYVRMYEMSASKA